MEVYEKCVEEVSRLIDIKCDRCGKSCKHYIHDKTFNLNYAKVEPEFGYGSKLDGLSINPKYLCEDCFSEIFHINENEISHI